MAASEPSKDAEARLRARVMWMCTGCGTPATSSLPQCDVCSNQVRPFDRVTRRWLDAAALDSLRAQLRAESERAARHATSPAPSRTPARRIPIPRKSARTSPKPSSTATSSKRSQLSGLLVGLAGLAAIAALMLVVSLGSRIRSSPLAAAPTSPPEPSNSGVTRAVQPAQRNASALATAIPPARPASAKAWGFITDDAHILTTDAVQRLEAVTQDLERRTGYQLAVVTVASMPDTLAGAAYANRYAQELADHRRSRAHPGFNGLVFLIAAKEQTPVIIRTRDAPINAESILDIQNGLITPRLRQSDVAGALLVGTEALAAAVSRAAAQALPPTSGPAAGVGRTATAASANTNSGTRGEITGVANAAPTIRPITRAPPAFTITSSPTGATVIIDRGAYRGVTPFRIALKPGPHGIEIALEGFKTKLDMVRVGTSSKEVNYDLDPISR